MENKIAFDVKIVSTETIKPSTPTPSHLKTYKLSLVDQIHPAYHTIMLLFYPKTIDTPPGGPDLNVLKIALSKTLSKYYLFAGRCMDDCTVSCNDEGISFTETRVNCVLSDFLTSSNKIDHLHKLTPPEEFKAAGKALPELVPLAFQVNVFSCGGVVIGCYKLHKLLLDGTSLVAFLKHWAAVAASGTVPVAPDFNAVLSTFPPQPAMCWRPLDADISEYRAMVNQYQGVKIVARNFVFTKETINNLRAMAATNELPKPTRFEALAGFVWKRCMVSAYNAEAMHVDPDPSIMSILVNMRPRFNPPLTSTCMGNLITTVSARANGGMDLSDLVRKIHASVSNVSKNIESYKRGENVEALVADILPFRGFNNPGMYDISSWCQFGLEEINFGFGKPKWASPTNGILSPGYRNVIFFACDSKGDGIEVWLYLEEKEMQILESDKQFLAFASPN